MPGRNTGEKDGALVEIVVVVIGPQEKTFGLITQFKIYQSTINSVLPALTPQASRWRSFF